MSPCRTMHHPESLAGEVRIRWAADAHPELFAYLREGVVSMPFRRRRPASWRVPGRLVAWAEVEDWVLADTPGRFRRRCWFLAPGDGPEGPYAGGGYHLRGRRPVLDPPGLRVPAAEVSVMTQRELRSSEQSTELGGKVRFTFFGVHHRGSRSRDGAEFAIPSRGRA